MARGRLVIEVQTNLRVDGFRFAAGLEVHIEDEIVAGIEPPRHPAGFRQHRRIRFPEEKMTVRVESISSI